MSHSLFLKSVKAHNPKLFWLMMVFIIMSFIFTLLRIEAPPFYVYSMYSQPAGPKEEHTIYVLECDGVPFNEPEIWNHHRRIQFNYSIDYYSQCIAADSNAADGVKAFQHLNKLLGENNFYYKRTYTQRSDIARYPHWLKQYMQSLLAKEIQQIKVYKIGLIYQPDGTLRTVSKTLLCEA